jgi:hypothetical protein
MLEDDISRPFQKLVFALETNKCQAQISRSDRWRVGLKPTIYFLARGQCYDHDFRNFYENIGIFKDPMSC